jgi:hypothetical protein
MRARIRAKLRARMRARMLQTDCTKAPKKGPSYALVSFG